MSSGLRLTPGVEKTLQAVAAARPALAEELAALKLQRHTPDGLERLLDAVGDFYSESEAVWAADASPENEARFRAADETVSALFRLTVEEGR